MTDGSFQGLLYGMLPCELQNLNRCVHIQGSDDTFAVSLPNSRQSKWTWHGSRSGMSECDFDSELLHVHQARKDMHDTRKMDG